MRQPIRHVYDRAQLGLVRPKQWTKYCDARVTTFQYDERPVDALVEFIRTHTPGFLNASHVRAYLPGSHVSVLVDEGLKGALVSRPVHFTIGAHEQPAEVYEFWVGENLEALMCTHEFHRPHTPALFWRDTPLPMLVPVVKHPVYWIETSKYRKHKAPVTKITAASILTLRNRLVTSTFQCRAVPSVERLLELIEHKVVSAYCTPETTLIFKNSMHVEKNKSVLDLVAVIGKSTKGYAAFASLVYDVRETYGWVRIHGLSDYAAVHRKEPAKTTMRYAYAFNYYAPRTPPEKCLFI
jgi:hypothetical protein